VRILAGLVVIGLASSQPAERWWRHVEYLASDELEGRGTGSPGHQKAVDYVSKHLREAGLKPCGTKGYRQPIALVERKLDESQSRLALVRGGQETELRLGSDAVLSTRTDLAESLEAGLVFAGYGLSIPEQGYDDLAGLDLKGKVVVYLSGSPETVPGPLRAHFSSAGERAKALLRAGAVGSLSIPNPKNSDVPWARTVEARLIPSMAQGYTSLDETKGVRLSGSINPDAAGQLFAGADHKLEDLMALSTASKPLPRFPLKMALRAKSKIERRQLVSDNVCGMLPGTVKESVVLSAHLDHLGRSATASADQIYNGAMDNASGIATLIEVARSLKERKERPRRTLVFLAVTGEEKGLIGSRFFASFPTVPAMVANINFDMYLPLHPLEYIMALGLEESTLRQPLEAVTARLKLKVQPDLEPQRNRFIRSDQYSFIQKGVPALALKFGYEPKSAADQIQKEWIAKRYHAVSDDLSQPVDRQAATQFNKVIEELALAVANQVERPHWNEASFFRRFAQ
jgi:hypothetical protein